MKTKFSKSVVNQSQRFLSTTARWAVFGMFALLLGAGSASAQRSVYVVTVFQQFGTVDLGTGAFHQIGASTPEPDANLVWGPDGFLRSITASGNLVKINPVTGETTVIGQTGLGFNAFDLAEVRGKLYLTDFSNNIYSVDPQTGAATLLGATGMPPDPTVPFTLNPDGTFNLCDETFYGIHGKLYASFDSFAVDPNPGDPNYLAITTHVAPALYEIDPSTGIASRVGATDLGLGASFEMDGRVFAFKSVVTGFADGFPEGLNQLFTLDLETGATRFLQNIDLAAGPISGAAPVRGWWTKSE